MTARAVRGFVAMLAALAVAATTAPAVHADGNPIADVLVQRDVILPSAPRVQPALARTLTRLLAEVRAQGFPTKVAVVGSPADITPYGTYFNRPQAYADLLADGLVDASDGRTSAVRHLLVVMPGGFGGEGLGDRVDAALAPVRIDAATQSDGLTRAAILVVARIGRANGLRVVDPPEPRAALDGPARPAGSSGISPLLALVPIGLGAVLAAALVRRARAVRARGAASSDRSPNATNEGDP